jgi:hypothetical protein
MKSSFRPTSPDDLGNVTEFLRRVFNSTPDAPYLHPSIMAWKYWDRRDDWEGPRAYILERDGAILAHAGLYPLTFEAGAIRGVQMIDWASSKESPGAGLALLQKLAAMFDFIYSIGGSEMTCKILPTFGFVECAKQWRGARPLRPLQQILTHQHRNWKLAPRLARNLRWAWPHMRPPEGLVAEEIGPGDISGEFYSQSSAEARFTPRPHGFFEYLLRCPIGKTRLYGIRDARGSKGHFAIGMVRGQARVAGVWLGEPNCEAWRAAFSLAQQTAMRLDGAYEFAAAGTEGASRQGAIESGLRIIGEPVPVYLLNKKRKLSLPQDFQFQLSDDDSFYMDLGISSYWT